MRLEAASLVFGQQPVHTRLQAVRSSALRAWTGRGLTAMQIRAWRQEASACERVLSGRRLPSTGAMQALAAWLRRSRGYHDVRLGQLLGRLLGKSNYGPQLASARVTGPLARCEASLDAKPEAN
jgi:hypothetical protein